MKKFFSLILVFCFVCQLFSQSQQLSLEQIIDSAIVKHPKLINSRISIETAKLGNNQLSNSTSTEILFRQGYLFSNIKSQELEVRQNIGSPITWIADAAYSRQELIKAKAQYGMTEKMIIAGIKKAYYDCIFRRIRFDLLKQQHQFLIGIIKHDSIPFVSDTIELERVLIENLITDAASQADMAYNDLLAAENNLVLAAFLDIETIPADTMLKMYQLIPASDTSTRTPARLFGAVIESEYQYKLANYKRVRSRYYPEIYLGYKNLSFQGHNNLNAWQIGLSFPLWFLPQRAATQTAKYDLLKAVNERKWNETEIQANAANLMVMLNNYFERLNYFYDYSLEQAEMIEGLTKAKIKKTSHCQLSDIQYLIKANQIRINYFETLNRYNQNAIELEVYAY